MTSFKNFLLEYLTDRQREFYKNHPMTDETRRNTDHFFGVGNDKIEGEIKASSSHGDEKSSLHREVERHIGKQLSHEEYRSGKTSDKHGRITTIGKLIKDQSLRDSFASTHERMGSKTDGKTFKNSIHRGAEVGGQTNYVPNDQHPNGHPWKSCKALTQHDLNGHRVNTNVHDVVHGTVVHFVHDDDGKEIYRASLQPHYNHSGDVVYKKDAEYGNVKPEFTQETHRIADRLSAGKPEGIYHHRIGTVHLNSQTIERYHLGDNPDLSHHAKTDDYIVAKAVIEHPNATHEHFKTLSTSSNEIVAASAIHNGNFSNEELKNLHDTTSDDYVKETIARVSPDKDILHYHSTNGKHMSASSIVASKHHTVEHLDNLHKHDHLINTALQSPLTTEKHLLGAIKHYPSTVASHPNATPKVLGKLLKHPDTSVRVDAVKNPNITPEQLKSVPSTGKHWVAGDWAKRILGQ